MNHLHDPQKNKAGQAGNRGLGLREPGEPDRTAHFP